MQSNASIKAKFYTWNKVDDNYSTENILAVLEKLIVFQNQILNACVGSSIKIFKTHVTFNRIFSGNLPVVIVLKVKVRPDHYFRQQI